MEIVNLGRGQLLGILALSFLNLWSSLFLSDLARSSATWLLVLLIPEGVWSYTINKELNLTWYGLQKNEWKENGIRISLDMVSRVMSRATCHVTYYMSWKLIGEAIECLFFRWMRCRWSYINYCDFIISNNWIKAAVSGRSLYLCKESQIHLNVREKFFQLQLSLIWLISELKTLHINGWRTKGKHTHSDTYTLRLLFYYTITQF